MIMVMEGRKRGKRNRIRRKEKEEGVEFVMRLDAKEIDRWS